MEDRQLRDEIAEDYKRSYARLGVANVSYEDFQRLAAADLELSDKAEQEVSTPAPESRIATPEEIGAKDASKAEQLAEEVGARFEKRDIVEANPVMHQVTEKHYKLMRRLQQMLACEDTGKRYKTIADRPFLYPDLAHKILAAHADMTLNRKGYRGLSAKDKNRQFLRVVEDCADRSTGRLGAWWCK